MFVFGVHSLLIFSFVCFCSADTCISSLCACDGNNISCVNSVPDRPPVILNSTSLSSSTILLTWRNPPERSWNCRIDGYKIKYESFEQGTFSMLTIPCSVSSYTLTGLTPNTKYGIRAASYNIRGVSTFSRSIYVKTGAEELPSEVPSNVTASSVGSSTLLIKWMTPSHGNSRFVVGFIVTAKYLNDTRTVTVLANRHSVYFFNLQRGKEYAITIAMYNSKGRGPPSHPIYMKTEEVEQTTVTTMIPTSTTSCSGFDCLNGKCLPNAWVCDGQDDCGNSNDEKNCTLSTNCRSTDFQCGDGSCIPGRWHCDDEDDCGDNSDEINCQTVMSGCGGERERTGSYGYIVSKFSYENQNNSICRWDIIVPHGMFVKIHFSRLRTPRSENCTVSYVAIYSENGVEEARFCGRQIPPDTVIQSNHVKIVFNSNSTRGRGLYLRWSAVKEHNSQWSSTLHTQSPVHTSPKSLPETFNNLTSTATTRMQISTPLFSTSAYGLIYSSNNPKLYTSPAPFFKTSSEPTSDGTTMTISTTSDETTSTSSSIVQNSTTPPTSFKQNSTTPTTSSGQNSTTPPISSGQNFTMIPSGQNFTMNPSGQNSTMTPSQSTLFCDKVFRIDNETSGYIDSSELNETFDTRCNWYIKAPEGYTIHLHFTDFNLVEFAYCLYNSVIVIDGEEPGVAVSGPHCGSTPPPDIFTFTNEARIILQLDPVNGTSSFTVEFSAIEMPKLTTIKPRPRIHCDHDINYTQPGYINSPRFGLSQYPENLRCLWRIFAPVGYILRLHFVLFDVEYSQDCSYDALIITDGTVPGGNILATLCGQVTPDDILSNTNSVTLSFVSDSNKGGSGFNITYSISNQTDIDKGNYVENMCRNGTVMVNTDTSGEILSPGYAVGRKYPENINCSWIVEAPPGEVITLSFNDFGVEKERDCLYDSLSVFDSKNNTNVLIRKMCGPSYPNRLTSTGNRILLRFHSDDSDTRSGFNITYNVHTYIPPCLDNEFRCGNDMCINSSLVCNNVSDCMDGTDEIVCSMFDTNCGNQTIKPENIAHKIVGGQEAKIGSWPWQVSMNHEGDHLCGGTLIHPQWVITATHCFEQDRSPKHWNVVLAKHHVYRDDPGTVVAPVQTIIVNDDYDPFTTSNDIALVKLREPVQLTDKVDTVCLPESQVNPGTVCYVTGFGEVVGTCCPYVLKQAPIPVIDTHKCNDTSRLAGQITNNMFCAGYDRGGIDACHGDSGGPFVCPDSKGRFELSGITSFGIGCGDPKAPGVYTLVANYISWIHQNIAEYS